MAYSTFGNYPYPVYPVNGYSAVQQPQYTQQSGGNYTAPQQNAQGIIWVDGEVGAKAFQLPSGWPANTPMPLWDTNDTIIYLKSTNPMGMPNPLQRIHYRMEEHDSSSGQSCRAAAPALLSGEQGNHAAQYVTKEDFEQMKRELRESITEAMNAQTRTPTAKKGGQQNESAV